MTYIAGQLVLEIDKATASPVFSRDGGMEIENRTGEPVIMIDAQGPAGTLGIYIPDKAIGSIKPKRPGKPPKVNFVQYKLRATGSATPSAPLPTGTIAISDPAGLSPAIIERTNAIAGADARPILVTGNKIVLTRDTAGFRLTQS